MKSITRRLPVPARSQAPDVLCHALVLARTIADLAEAETIAAPHIAEALPYRARGEAG